MTINIIFRLSISWSHRWHYQKSRTFRAHFTWISRAINTKKNEFSCKKALRRSTTNSRNCLGITWASSRSDVTTGLCPDPYLRCRGPLRTRLQRGIKNRRFDQIKIFFEEMITKAWRLFLAKKKIGVRCTLTEESKSFSPLTSLSSRNFPHKVTIHCNHHHKSQ